MTTFDTSQLQTSPMFLNMSEIRSALLTAVIEYSDDVPGKSELDVTVSFPSIEDRNAFVEAFLTLRGVKKGEAK